MIRRIAQWLQRLFRGEPAAPSVPQLVRFPRQAGNPLVPTARVELDQLRTLRFTLRESIEFRRRTGYSVFQGGWSLMELDEADFLELLCVMAQHEDPAVTPEQLAPHVYSERITDILATAAILLNEFCPPMPEGAEENPLMAGALSHLTNRATTRSPRKPSGSATTSSGGSRPV